MTDQITIVVADDHSAFRHGIRSLLASTSELHILDEASTGKEAVDVVRKIQPDVVLMDLNMPVLNGIEATRAIVSHSPHVAVLILSMYDDDDSVFMAMRAGARGYVLKGASRTELVGAITAVSRGDAIFGPGIAHRVLTYFAGQNSVDTIFPELTARERDILDRVARGQNNPNIAADLFLSPKTVRNHVSNIFTKLQVASRAEAIILARDAGLGRRPPQ